jgi:hypothetical protein
MVRNFDGRLDPCCEVTAWFGGSIPDQVGDVDDGLSAYSAGSGSFAIGLFLCVVQFW